jgi:hypothetical protein
MKIKKQGVVIMKKRLNIYIPKVLLYMGWGLMFLQWVLARIEHGADMDISYTATLIFASAAIGPLNWVVKKMNTEIAENEN